MRVLMFGWEFPPYQAGGLATATLGLVKGLLQRGVDVTLVVPFPVKESGVEGLRLIGATGGRLRTRRIRSPLGPYMSAGEYKNSSSEWIQGTGSGSGSVYGRNIFDEVERFADVAAEIAAEEPHDLIHTHDWITYAAGIEAQKISGKPLIAHIHATEYDRSGEFANEEIFQRELSGMQTADLVIANSRYLKRLVIQHYGIQEKKVDVVYWGIERDRPEYHVAPPEAFKADVPVVLFLGRVTRQKGPDYFVEMARKVADLEPETRFIIAGSGDMLPRIMSRAAELGLADKIHFTGPLQGADVFRVFKMADVCVMPSVSEPFGLVALESIRSGTPCIVPRESGAAEVLKHALKVDFWDIDEMANKVVGILRHPELYAELRERGLEEVSRPQLSLDEPARRVAKIYQKIAHRADHKILQEA